MIQLRSSDFSPPVRFLTFSRCVMDDESDFRKVARIRFAGKLRVTVGRSIP